MTSRIGTYGSTQLYLARLTAIQTRIQAGQGQVATEMKSPTYSGIAGDANRLLNLENEKASATQYIKNNSVAETKLDAAQTSVDAITSTIKNFRKQLATYQSSMSHEQGEIDKIQEYAFRSLQDMQSYLSTTVDGQYVFSGGKVSTVPVDLPASSLAGFQEIYDGYDHKYPTTRAANLLDVDLEHADTGDLVFNATYGIMTPDTLHAMSSVAATGRITVAGTTSNNADFTVASHAVTNYSGVPLAEGDAAATAFITAADANTLNAATGTLSFSFAPDGSMKMSSATTGALSGLAAGAKFTIAGDNNYAGAYRVIDNTSGVVTFGVDTDTNKIETLDATTITLLDDSNADTIPDTTVGAMAAGNASISVSGNTVTLTVPAGSPDLSTAYAVGDLISIQGTDYHDGTFRVTARTATTVSFDVNPDALRVAKFLPQSGRTDVNLTFDNGTGTRTAADYGSLSFTPAGTSGERITAATTGGFLDGFGNAYPPVGATITLDSTSGVNDGVYKVISNDGTNIEVESTRVTAETASTSALSVTANSWYDGDTMTVTHRVDVGRTVDLGIYASESAFEKAIRAMSLIAQGEFGTAGGLENNGERVSQAMFLLNDSLEHPAAGTPPFGTEETGDVESLASRIGYVQREILDKSEKHEAFIGFLETRIIEIQNVDLTEAVTTLLDDSRALQTAYQALAQIRSLSLMDFLK